MASQGPQNGPPRNNNRKKSTGVRAQRATERAEAGRLLRDSLGLPPADPKNQAVLLQLREEVATLRQCRQAMARRATAERDYGAFLAQLDDAIGRLVAEIRNFTPPEE
eukprot:12117620-Prorocentrum_lima.AAC.1